MLVSLVEGGNILARSDSIFGDLRDELHDNIDLIFSEAIIHFPLYKSQVDNRRQSAEFYGILRTGNLETEVIRLGRPTANIQINASGGTLRISMVAYPDLKINKGDKIRAIDRRDKPMFEVMSVDAKSHSRLILELGDA